jgi:hypothetical protein
VTGFCVTSNGAPLNSASNSLRLAQALDNRRLLDIERAAVTWEQVSRGTDVPVRIFLFPFFNSRHCDP